MYRKKIKSNFLFNHAICYTLINISVYKLQLQKTSLQRYKSVKTAFITIRRHFFL